MKVSSEPFEGIFIFRGILTLFLSRCAEINI